jgi:hypothetical protein
MINTNTNISSGIELNTKSFIKGFTIGLGCLAVGYVSLISFAYLIARFS